MKRFFTFFFLLTGSIHAGAQNLSLDKTYGKNGIVLTPPGGEGGNYSASVIQPDDKIITAGDFGDSVGNNLTIWSTLQRYNTDGSLDESFGDGGRVLTLFDSPYITEGYGAKWASIAVQPNGFIVAAASLYKKDQSIEPPFNDRGDVAVARFKADGSPDSSFGVKGIVITDVNKNAVINAMKLQKDGKIVLTGEISDNAYNIGSILIMRYNPDGTLDKTFGGGTGYITERHGGYTGLALALQPDGKIVIGGTLVSDGNFAVYRYLPDGTPDETFGTSGRVLTQFSETVYTQINSLALLENGSILAGGIAANEPYTESMTVVRYTPDGVIDKSFGKEGKAFVSFGLDTNSNVVRLFVKPDGTILLAGTAGGSLNTTQDEVNFALAQLLPNGTPDTDFGTYGKVNTDLGGGTIDDAKSAEMQKDGNVVIVGNSYNRYPPFLSFYALARYNTGGKDQKPIVIKVKRFLHSHGITWQGTTSSGTAYYRVEQSTGGGAVGFREAGRVPASGGSDNYTYTLPAATTLTNATPATAYYRVTAVSATGRSAASNVVALRDVPSIAIYPNPVAGKLTLTNLDAGADSKINVTDMGGTVWLTAIARQQAAATYDVSGLKAGTYLVTVSSREQSTSLTFVKQ